MGKKSSSADVFVQYHMFGIVEGNHWDQDDDSSGNGLICSLKSGAYVYTGIHTGYVRVTASALDGPPASPDVKSWQEVVDTSIRAPRGKLRVRAFEDEAAGLPRLSHRGPGWYRVRIHARGRDTDIDGTADEAFEHYLIECWPATEQQPTVAHQLSDQYGASLRAP